MNGAATAVPPIIGNETMMLVVGALAGGVALTIVFVAAVLILVRREGEWSGAPGFLGVGLGLAGISSFMREDWWILAVAVLMLPALLGFRAIIRRVVARQRNEGAR